MTFPNRQHPNIKFTIEKEKSNQLPFLDILNDSSSNKLVTSVYRKRTYTGLITNCNSFTSPNYKNGLLKTLIDRIFHINNTWSGIHYDILNLKPVLQKYEFPLKLYDKSVSKYLSNVFKQKENQQMPLFESSKKRFYKLPYIGNSSNQTKMKLKNIFLKYCKPNTNIELVFSSIKISSLFSMKDRVPLDVRTYVVYKLFVAAVKLITLVAQNDIYYHLNYYYIIIIIIIISIIIIPIISAKRVRIYSSSTRITERLETDKKSHV